MRSDFDATSASAAGGPDLNFLVVRPPVTALTVILPDSPARPVYDTLKRAMDIAVSLFLGLAFLPVIVVAMILIKLDSTGPCFFSQVRVGLHGRHFRMWKMRSMIQNAERRKHDLPVEKDRRGDVLFKLRNDPRVTRVGRLLRKSSIDELPQLWNVLRGDMSLVGPRPALPEEVQNYAREHLHRLSVKPGLTCVWQVSGRSNVPYEGQVVMDIAYVRHRSLWLDVMLLLKTIPAVLSGKGAF